MKYLVFLLTILVSPLTFAQSSLTAEVLQDSNGTCNLVRPHSYGCNAWTFEGNRFFPLMEVSWRSLRGSWAAVTYADPIGDEGRGPEFQLLVQLGRNSRPAGVHDFLSNRPAGPAGDVRLGPMIINDSVFSIPSWHDSGLSGDVSSLRQLDRTTVQIQGLDAAGTAHLFTCRLFNRNNTGHLLCAWDKAIRGRFEHQGFLGFLRQ